MRLTDHAIHRIGERCSLTPAQVQAMLNAGAAVLFACDKGRRLTYHLLYDPVHDQPLVLVCAVHRRRGPVVATVLTRKLWNRSTGREVCPRTKRFKWRVGQETINGAKCRARSRVVQRALEAATLPRSVELQNELQERG